MRQLARVLWEACDPDHDRTFDPGPDKAQATPEVWGAAHLMGARRWDLLSLLPLVAIVALVAMVAALAWIVGQSDDERAKAKLAADVLWVEQTPRFQMAVDEDMLVRLALDAASGTGLETLKAGARLNISTSPEMLALCWFDSAGRLIAAVP